MHRLPSGTHGPTAEWIARFSARMLNLTPDLSPLAAVRRAMAAFPDTGDNDPEHVAEVLAGHLGQPYPGVATDGPDARQ